MLCYSNDTLVEKRDQELCETMLKASYAGVSIPVRYGKVLFCGAAAAGKTNFLNLLMEENFEPSHISTILLEPQQAIAMKAQSSSNKGEVKFEKMAIDKEILVLESYLEEVYDEPKAKISNAGETSDHEHNYENMDHHPKSEQPDAKFESENANTTLKSVDLALSKKVEGEKMPKKSRSKDVWNILTFMDTGGQPQFISMLPAVNSYAMITFIVHKMKKDGLDETVEVKYTNEKGELYCKPHPHHYTYCQLIQTLISYASNVMLPDIEFINMHKDDKGKKNEIVRSILLVGTHSGDHELKEDDIREIDRKLQSVVDVSHVNDIKGDLNKNHEVLVPVDNEKQGMHQDKSCEFQAINVDTVRYTRPSEIRHHVQKFLEMQDKVNVPIKWLLLELEIRKVCQEKNCYFISFEKVLELAKDRKFGYAGEFHDYNMDTDKFIRQGLRFHYLFGVLLYFENVKGVPELVITDHKWLFNKLSKIVEYSFKQACNTQDDKKKFILNGIFKKSFLDVHSLGIDEDFKNSDISMTHNAINIFLNILQHLLIVAPFSEDDEAFSSEDDEKYFMPFVLKSCELNSLKGKIPEYKADEPNPLYIQLKSKDNKTYSFPRGAFCFLVVKLMLSEESIIVNEAYINFITLRKSNTSYYITLIDNIEMFCLELHVTNTLDKQFVHYKVLEQIKQALDSVAKQFNIYSNICCGFLCEKCKEMMHIAYLEGHDRCVCEKGILLELKPSQRFWLKHDSEVCTSIMCMHVCIYVRMYVHSYVLAMQWLI